MATKGSIDVAYDLWILNTLIDDSIEKIIDSYHCQGCEAITPLFFYWKCNRLSLKEIDTNQEINRWSLWSIDSKHSYWWFNWKIIESYNNFSLDLCFVPFLFLNCLTIFIMILIYIFSLLNHLCFTNGVYISFFLFLFFSFFWDKYNSTLACSKCMRVWSFFLKTWTPILTPSPIPQVLIFIDWSSRQGVRWWCLCIKIELV